MKADSKTHNIKSRQPEMQASEMRQPEKQSSEMQDAGMRQPEKQSSEMQDAEMRQPEKLSPEMQDTEMRPPESRDLEKRHPEMRQRYRPDRTMALTTILCLLPILMGIALYDRLPDRVPSHFDFQGNVNGTMGRFQIVFILPITMAALNVLIHFMMEADPKKKNYAAAMKLIVKWLVPILTCVMLPACLLKGLGMEVPVSGMVMELIGLLFILMGNYMPKCRQNYTMGIRTPWTLSSEENWNKTHHLAGYLWILCGICLMLSGLFRGNHIISFCGVIVSAFFPCVYSYLLYRRGI